MNARNTKVLSVSLPPEVYEEVNRLAKIERKTKSELIRSTIKAYRRQRFEREWKKIRKMGGEIREKFNIRNEDELLEYIHGD